MQDGGDGGGRRARAPAVALSEPLDVGEQEVAGLPGGHEPGDRRRAHRGLAAREAAESGDPRPREDELRRALLALHDQREAASRAVGLDVRQRLGGILDAAEDAAGAACGAAAAEPSALGRSSEPAAALRRAAADPAAGTAEPARRRQARDRPRPGARAHARDRLELGRPGERRRGQEQRSEGHGSAGGAAPGAVRGGRQEQPGHRRQDDDGAGEPGEVPVVEHQRDLQPHREPDRHQPGREQRAAAGGRGGEAPQPDPGQRRRRRGDGRHVVGVHDPAGDAEHHGAQDEPATEPEQEGELQAVAPSPGDDQRRAAAEQGQRQEPAALVAHRAREQPERAGRAAGQDAEAARRRAALLAGQPAEAVVLEQQPEGAVVRRARDPGPVGRGRQRDGGDPEAAADQQHAAGGGQVAELPPQAARREPDVRRGQPRHDQQRERHLGLEGQPDERGAAEQPAQAPRLDGPDPRRTGRR